MNDSVDEVRRRRVLVLVPAVALLIGATLASCSPSSGKSTVAVSAARPYVGPLFESDVSAQRRFGSGPGMGAPTAGGQPGGAGQTGDAALAAEVFRYELPSGWERLAPTSLRAVNVRVTREPRAECTLTLLSGDGGGLGANIDRWRKQMGLAPIEPAELAALSRGSLLGRSATRVDFAGDYAGMGGTGGADFRMVGLLVAAPEGSAFLKFVGPAAVVADELEAFDLVAATLRPATDVEMAAAASGGTTAAPTGANDTSTPSTSGTSSATLAWIAPSSWIQGPERMMRDVTYTTDPAGTVECYISVLGGEGGGIRANFDRWRGQMSQPPLTTEELAGLERVPCLGATALLIEIQGEFKGMSGESHGDALMLGAVATFDGQTVFVKLVGPTAAAEVERENFRAFVASLERAR